LISFSLLYFTRPLYSSFFFFSSYVDHRDLHSFPTRRSSDLLVIKVFDCYRPVRAVADFVRWARDPRDQAAKAKFYPAVDKRTLLDRKKHTSELQSLTNLVCRLLLEKKKNITYKNICHIPSPQ